MSKTIIFCADGTWNTINQDAESPPEDATNVYQLFTLLQGAVIARTKFTDVTGDVIEQEKAITSGPHLQIAKYINGVGNSKNKIKKLLGGGFGAGLVQRIVRGFTFISRNYQPGDKIYILGFSRGAYTARALAGMIASQGLLADKYNRGAYDAYKLGTQAWYRYRKSVKDANLLSDFATAVVNLDVWDFFDDDLKAQDFVNVDIESVVVWDTVGSMGIPKYDVMQNQLVDAFRFADTKLSPKVKHGFHAVALDEQRLLFTPTLWDKALNVKQMVFPGGHSDVGGGYQEKGLSDAALQWMIEELEALGVQFGKWQNHIKPNVTAPAHQEWRKLTSGKGKRQFSKQNDILAHPFVIERQKLPSVGHHLDKEVGPYRPSNWPPT